MAQTIAVFGLGNPLMSDEGVGIEVLHALEARDDLPSDVELIDLGTGGLSLLHETAGRRKLIFVDCALMGATPGEIRRFRPAEVRSQKVGTRYSLHEGDLLANLELAAAVGDCPNDVVIFGIEPASMDQNMALTPVLASRLDDYVSRLVAEIEAA